MPRLPQKLLYYAHSISPLLPLILRTTRELPSAINELRWLREHVEESQPSSRRQGHRRLLGLCQRRERGEPLQYILGSQPFGELEIKCKPGVLIPRPETEAYTMHLAKLLNEGCLHETITKEHTPIDPHLWKLKHRHMKRIIPPPEPSVLKIVDLCSGSGCISLLLQSQLSAKFPNLKIRGWDISPDAIELARENINSNIENGSLGRLANDQVSFCQADIFKPPDFFYKEIDDMDIIISNPPYISASKFITQTTRSVRNWEPHLALVPAKLKVWTNHDKLEKEWRRVDPADIFYRQLMRFHMRWLNCKVLLMEIGDEDQARRVVAMALSVTQIKKSNMIEIWRDWPAQEAQVGEEKEVVIEGRRVQVKGAGKMRAVVLFLKRKGEGEKHEQNSEGRSSANLE